MALNAVKTAVGGTDVAGDSAGGCDVGVFEVNIVGYEEAAGSDGTGSCSFMEFWTADVGAAGGIAARGVAETFELAFAYVFELNAIGAGGGCSVEVDRDTVATPDE